MPDHQAQVILNYSKFKELLPSLGTSNGKFALLRDGSLTQIYDTFEDALKTAHAFYSDGLFSIQKITNRATDLGYRSRALHRG